MAKYKCPDCKKYEMEKQVYTEEVCSCGHVNHHPHLGAKIRKYRKNKNGGENELRN